MKRQDPTDDNEGSASDSAHEDNAVSGFRWVVRGLIAVIAIGLAIVSILARIDRIFFEPARDEEIAKQQQELFKAIANAQREKMGFGENGQFTKTFRAATPYREFAEEFIDKVRNGQWDLAYLKTSDKYRGRVSPEQFRALFSREYALERRNAVLIFGNVQLPDGQLVSTVIEGQDATGKSILDLDIAKTPAGYEISDIKLREKEL